MNCNVDAAIETARQVYKSGQFHPMQGAHYAKNNTCGCIIGALTVAGNGPVGNILASLDFCKSRYGLTEGEIAGLTHGWDGNPQHHRQYAHQQANMLAREFGLIV